MNRKPFIAEISRAAAAQAGVVTLGANASAEVIRLPGSLEGKHKEACFLACGYPVSNLPGGAIGEVALMEILQALADGKDASIEQFDGPFLALVWLSAQNTIRVVRDKFGLRSAYYKVTPSGISIADDIACLQGNSRTRLTSISEWLQYGAALAPLTMFEDLRTLAAGCLLDISTTDFSVKTSRYFSPEEYIKPEVYRENLKRSASALVEKFDATFDDAVACAVKGSKDVTILVSGGVDSSLLTAFARKQTNVTAVTVDLYGEGSETEIQFANAVAKHLGVTLQAVRFGPPEFRSHFCRTIQDLGAPIIVENAIALNYVSAYGHLPHGKLVLDGEGADALMAGSTGLFRYSMMIRHLAQITPLSGTTVRTLFERMRGLLGKFGLTTRSTLDGAGLDIDLAARRMELQHLTATIQEKFQHLPTREDREIATLMLREFYDYLVPLMLRIDKMSAASGTHTVLPYLQRPLFEFLANMDMPHKLGRNGLSIVPISKVFLKKQLEQYIPRSLVYRPKVGFGIPGWDWISLPDKWRKDCWLGEFFQLNTEALNHWHSTTTHRDKVFFLSLEVWGRLFDRRIPFDTVQAEWLEQQSAK